jgi:hypothetical protein
MSSRGVVDREFSISCLQRSTDLSLPPPPQPPPPFSDKDFQDIEFSANQSDGVLQRAPRVLQPTGVVSVVTGEEVGRELYSSDPLRMLGSAQRMRYVYSTDLHQRVDC